MSGWLKRDILCVFVTPESERVQVHGPRKPFGSICTLVELNLDRESRRCNVAERGDDSHRQTASHQQLQPAAIEKTATDKIDEIEKLDQERF